MESHRAARRQRRLPATGMPVKGEGRRGSSVVSLLIHVLIIVLIAMPVATHTGDVKEILQGAGGPGPIGGGGGGHNGNGGIIEKVHYVAVAPAPKPAPAAVVPPPVVTPPPKPVVPPPPPVVQPPEPVITPEPAKLEVKVAEAKLPDATAPTPGTGGRSGRDGSSGNGPGSGGGVGSGIGTGRGSNVGPGSGGGLQANYPPATTELFLPPLPYPDKVRGFHLVAEFDVDSTGKVLNYTFTPTRDGGYNRRLDETLKNTKFRPGTTPDGRPIRMKAQITYDF
jgi:outer membrane biosynthesis protein TonB